MCSSVGYRVCIFGNKGMMMLNCIWFGDLCLGYNLHEWVFFDIIKDEYQYEWDFLCFYIIWIHEKQLSRP